MFLGERYKCTFCIYVFLFLHENMNQNPQKQDNKLSLLPWLTKRPQKQNPVPPKAMHRVLQDWIFRLGQPPNYLLDLDGSDENGNHDQDENLA